MIPWSLVLKGAVILVVVGVLFSIYHMVNGRIEDYIATKELLQAKSIEVEEKKAQVAYLEKAATLESEFQNKKIAIIEDTNEKLSAAREREAEAHNAFTASRLDELSHKQQAASSSITVNERLTNRAAKATRRKLDRIQQLSDWRAADRVQPDARSRGDVQSGRVADTAN